MDYVERDEALAFAYNNSREAQERFFNFAYEKKMKRKNSRLALRFYLILPEVWYNTSMRVPQYQRVLSEDIANFLAKTLNVNKQDIMLFFHKTNEEGKHFHVHALILNQDINGKALRIQPHTLRDFHKAWEEFMAKKGYEVFRLRDYFPEFIKKEDAKTYPIPYYKSRIKALKKEVSAMARKLREIQLEETREHLNTLFDKEDKIFIVCIKRGDKPDVKYETLKVKQISEGFMSYLRYLNSQGYNIYYSLNAFKENAKQRKEEEAEEKQNKVYLDIDGSKLGKDGLEILKEILERYNIPKPTITVRTSDMNYQAIWKFKEKTDFEKLRKVMQKIEKDFHLDHTSDKARIFRLAGFNNKKRSEKPLDLVEIVESFTTKESYNFNEFEERVLREREDRPKKEKIEIIKSSVMQKTRKEGDYPTDYPRGYPTGGMEERKREERGKKYVGIRYIEQLEKFARKRGIFVSLDNLKRSEKPFSQSEIEWAFAKELLRRYKPEDVAQILELALKECRSDWKDKLARSPDYVKITIAKAMESLQGQLPKDPKPPPQPPPEEEDDMNFFSL